MVIFCLQMWKGSEKKKTKILTHGEIKKQLIELIVTNYIIETDNLNKKPEEVQKPEEAAVVIKQYEETTCTKKKCIISVAYHQGKVFKKFKDREKFLRLFTQFKVHKTTIIFKINISSYAKSTLSC